MFTTVNIANALRENYLRPQSDIVFVAHSLLTFYCIYIIDNVLRGSNFFVTTAVRQNALCE